MTGTWRASWENEQGKLERAGVWPEKPGRKTAR